MAYFLADGVVLRWLENPFVYNIAQDELFELDEESFKFLRDCIKGKNTNRTSFVEYCLNENILSDVQRKTKHPPILRSPVPSLRYLELQITNRCNLLCKHCYIEDHSYSELSLNDILSLLKEFEEMQGLRVLVTGGEPLLYTRFEELNDALPLYSVRKVLLTNGILINKRTIRKLNFDEIQISIDGLEKSHDALRGKGTFKKVMDSIRLAKESGFDVSVATIINPKNINDLDKLETILSSMEIKTWTVDMPCFEGRLRSNKEFFISPEEGGRYLKYGFGGDLHASSPGYGCGLHLIAVTAKGKVARCTFYSNKNVGTVKEGLKRCWERLRPVRLEELKCDCQCIETCRGGCRYRAELLTGDPFGKDLYRCSFYSSMQNKK